MAKFLVQTGIDSISVNADVASEIAEYVAEIEGIINNKSEEEPSQNHSNKKILKKWKSSQ